MKKQNMKLYLPFSQLGVENPCHTRSSGLKISEKRKNATIASAATFSRGVIFFETK